MTIPTFFLNILKPYLQNSLHNIIKNITNCSHFTKHKSHRANRSFCYKYILSNFIKAWTYKSQFYFYSPNNTLGLCQKSLYQVTCRSMDIKNLQSTMQPRVIIYVCYEYVGSKRVKIKILNFQRVNISYIWI